MCLTHGWGIVHRTQLQYDRGDWCTAMRHSPCNWRRCFRPVSVLACACHMAWPHWSHGFVVVLSAMGIDCRTGTCTDYTSWRITVCVGSIHLVYCVLRVLHVCECSESVYCMSASVLSLCTACLRVRMVSDLLRCMVCSIHILCIRDWQCLICQVM
jgi:hypothetical protein